MVDERSFDATAMLVTSRLPMTVEIGKIMQHLLKEFFGM
jgi:hypothetical protein